MKNSYPSILALAALAALAFSEDGSATLTPEQLDAVESALSGASSLQAEIDRLTSELAAANSTISQRDGRISELESSLTAALDRIENPAPQELPVNHTPEASEIKAATTFEEALAVCNDFIAKH